MKNLVFNSVLFFVLISFVTSCNTYKRHVTQAYYQEASPNTKLAIVPVKYHLNGPIAKRLDQEKREQVEEAEAYRFQTALAAHIIRKMGKRRRKVRVNLQDVNVTNKLLKESGYTLKEAFELLPSELGKILGVDAVMLVDIESNQLMTNFESEALKTGTYVLEGIFGLNNEVDFGNIPTGVTRANASIVDTKTNALLWANRIERLTKVKRSSMDAISNINHEFGRT
ncbi:MAG TPA: hypothetical protein ENK85_04200, partial [Saprospiraceae bacterium]|nr:hypothetical protein [Saprospiraceae bacterium]